MYDRSDREESRSPEASGARSADRAHDGLGRDLLIVDDAETNLVAYEAALAPLGRRPVLARSGTEALARLLDQDFALMLLDVSMPAMTGLETARLARQRARHHGMPIVFITGESSSSETILEAYELGACDFVVKPVLPEILRAKVRVYLELQDRASALVRDSRVLTEQAQTSRRAQYIAMLGHELRNPLAAMTSALEVVKVRDGQLGRELAILDRHLAHLTHLVNDLVDISHVTQTRIPLRREAVDVAAAIDDAIDFARPAFSLHAPRPTVHVTQDLLVDADRLRFVQVFTNLVANAVRYTPDHGSIRITAVPEGGHVRLCVRDTGVGIPPELLPSVFDAFVQGEQGLDRKDGGLGIGLTIVKTLVELHGGSVRAESEGVGLGAAFTVLWPAASSRTSTARSLPLMRPEASTQKLRALVVDHNEDAATLFGALLEELGHEAVVALDGATALETAVTFAPEIAFVDLGLRGMDGIELAGKLRALASCAATVLIAVTGYGQSEDRERSRAAGFQHHCVKPIELETLCSLIAAIRKP